jgi:hypothetical protein
VVSSIKGEKFKDESAEAMGSKARKPEENDKME